MTILKKCPTPIGTFRKSDGSIINARCNSWKCPYCSKIKKKRVLDRVSNGFKERKSIFGVTLTEVTETEKNIMQHWKKFRENLQHYFGFKLKFFWVKEFQKNGNRHIHILFEMPIPHTIIRDMWTQATAGKAYVVWINEYPVKKSAGYLAKYLTKSASDERFSVHERRYSFSHDDGFVLDVKTAFEKYGFVKPQAGTWIFQLGNPEPDMDDDHWKNNHEKYDETNWYCIPGIQRRKTGYGYPDRIIYYGEKKLDIS